jgi:hypothetical protein
MNKADEVIMDGLLEQSIRLERFTAGERKKVLAILDGLQKELRVKLMGDLTDFSKARVNKLLSESTAIIEAAYKEIAPGGKMERVVNTGLESLSDKELLGMGRPVDAYARNIALEEAILRQKNGAYLLSTTGRSAPSLRDAVSKQLGYDVPADELAKAVRGLASLYPDSVKASLTLGLEEVEISNMKSGKGTDLLGLARHEATATASTFATIGLEATIPTEAVLRALVNGSLIEGHAAGAWWAKQSDDLAFKFASQVRQGIAAGETLMDIVRRVAGSPRLGIPGIMDISRRNAGALVHTSIMQVANDARMAVYQANQDIMKGYRYLSTLDGNICPRCIARSGSTWDLEYKPTGGTKLEYVPTPIHFKCRCLILPILKSYKELGAPEIQEPPTGTRASDEGQVRADITMTEWLKGKPKAYVDDLLGPGRSDLFLKGKISLSDLVSQNGRPLTLEQLRGK